MSFRVMPGLNMFCLGSKNYVISVQNVLRNGLDNNWLKSHRVGKN